MATCCAITAGFAMGAAMMELSARWFQQVTFKALLENARSQSRESRKLSSEKTGAPSTLALVSRIVVSSVSS